MFELSSLLKEKNKLKSHEKYVKLNIFCNLLNIVMPPEDPKILEFNQYKKYDKTRLIIYADF